MDLLKCYQILDVPQDSTWEELRTAYRRQVQKHHPDRHQQHPDRQVLAKERMLELNEAFDTLEEYYKKNGHLPGEILKKTSRKTGHQSQTEAVSPKASERATYTPAEINPVNLKQATRKTSWGLMLVIVILGYLFFWEGVPESDKPDNTISSEKSHFNKNSIVKDGTLNGTFPDRGSEESGNIHYNGEKGIEKQTAPSPDPAPLGAQGKIHDGHFFTYGDTPGKVFEVQGVPTRTVGDIWFYGKSEVHFNKGAVVSWYNSPTHPLKVK